MNLMADFFSPHALTQFVRHMSFKVFNFMSVWSICRGIKNVLKHFHAFHSELIERMNTKHAKIKIFHSYLHLWKVISSLKEWCLLLKVLKMLLQPVLQQCYLMFLFNGCLKCVFVSSPLQTKSFFCTSGTLRPLMWAGAMHCVKGAKPRLALSQSESQDRWQSQWRLLECRRLEQTEEVILGHRVE